ncbi:serine/threonine-protein kinase [Leucobacter sp. W1153]|uniref:serine/threonine-protein kinase n=1 Tax=Leucobacter sp. W1153 TaxID=3439064 RepID=UPI003F336261
MPTPQTPPKISGLSYVRPLGEGGFASVYLYEQDLPRRMVAVKALKSGLESAEERADFQIETDAMARLASHPAIVSVHGAGVSADGRPYLVMEHCPGSMREQTRNRPAQLAQVLDVGVRLAGALETAHRAGVLHRDIKPSNVLITTMGRPSLADFGIASLRGRTSSDIATTAVTIPWSAPEVLSGHTAGTVATEIWSLGATLYTFAAGRSPFELSDPAKNTRSLITARILKASYTPIPGAEGYQALDAVLKKAMMPRPEQRFTSMDAFAGVLQQLQRHYGFDVTPFDMTRDLWPADESQDVASGVVRGQSMSSVRVQSRAEARAALAREQADRDGVVPDPPASSLRAGLIGAGAAVVVIAVAVAIAGWLGLL